MASPHWAFCAVEFESFRNRRQIRETRSSSRWTSSRVTASPSNCGRNRGAVSRAAPPARTASRADAREGMPQVGSRRPPPYTGFDSFADFFTRTSIPLHASCTVRQAAGNAV
jgi:hypothetical protein